MRHTEELHARFPDEQLARADKFLKVVKEGDLMELLTPHEFVLTLWGYAHASRENDTRLEALACATLAICYKELWDRLEEGDSDGL